MAVRAFVPKVTAPAPKPATPFGDWMKAGAWGGGNNPFRVPTPTSPKYGPGQFPTTPIGNNLLEDSANRAAAFAYYNQGYGVDPMGNYGKWLQSLQNQVNTGYEAALAEDPELTFQKYYSLIYPQLQQTFTNFTPEQRGLNPSRFVGPLRIIPRGAS